MSEQVNRSGECQEIYQSLVLFIDRENCEGAEVRIQAHLQTCDSCCSERDSLELVKQLIARSCCPEPAPSEFRVKISQLIAQIEIEATEGS
ncbi:MAG: mycothiol system anti-sigma-R factor [Actinobacteria bacterium]|nr:mycothiol system anti-sigma-R factor [Actinomycetota bacterium]NBY14989.1 mycothiol system anti-sigma-R factor [Actinomycetota bacterium]